MEKEQKKEGNGKEKEREREIEREKAREKEKDFLQKLPIYSTKTNDIPPQKPSRVRSFTPSTKKKLTWKCRAEYRFPV